LQWPEESKLLLFEAVRDIEYVQNDKEHYEYSDIEESNIGGEVCFGDPVGDGEYVQDRVHVSEHSVRLPRVVHL
jgi:hypothetical protein